MKIIIADDLKDSKELFELYSEWVTEKVSPKTQKITFEEYKKQLNKSTTFIAKEEGKIVGFLMCRMKKSNETTIMYKLKKGETYANIDSIYIAPKYRNKGIGAALVNSCKEELKKHGKYKIIVLADSTNPSELINFYEKNGFKTLFVSMINEDF
ncbi:MAG: GNAT family N-acetyltransferase [Candidatus Nanoarchaeia archaeon]|nr:GNAT family N-acetyltransferase [Candidatus Nanoarchaeia archaeon]